eukprot:6994964-Prymnesium_polylepis.2
MCFAAVLARSPSRLEPRRAVSSRAEPSRAAPSVARRHGAASAVERWRGVGLRTAHQPPRTSVDGQRPRARRYRHRRRTERAMPGDGATWPRGGRDVSERSAVDAACGTHAAR